MKLYPFRTFLDWSHKVGIASDVTVYMSWKYNFTFIKFKWDYMQ